MSSTFNSRYFTTPPAYNLHFIYYLIFYYFIFSIIAFIYKEIKKIVNPTSWSTIPLIIYTIIIGFYIIISFSYNILKDIKDVEEWINWFNLGINGINYILIFVFMVLKRHINGLAWGILGLFCVSLLITIGCIIYIIATRINKGFTLLFFTSFFNILFLFLISIIYAFKYLFYKKNFSKYHDLVKAMKYLFFVLLGSHLFSLVCAFLNNEYADLSYIIINSYNYIIYWYILLSVLFIIADTIDAVTNDKSITLWILTCLLLIVIFTFFVIQNLTFEHPSEMFEKALNYNFKYAGESM